MDGLAEWVFSHVRINTPDGEVEGTQISRSFTFTNFKRAFTFMARSAELAERRTHHPDLGFGLRPDIHDAHRRDDDRRQNVSAIA